MGRKASAWGHRGARLRAATLIPGGERTSPPLLGWGGGQARMGMGPAGEGLLCPQLSGGRFSTSLHVHCNDLVCFSKTQSSCDHLEGWDGEGGREGDARGKRNGNILYMYNRFTLL